MMLRSRMYRPTVEALEDRTLLTTITLLGPTDGSTVTTLTPTFKWELSDAEDSTLYVSVLPKGEGLFPDDFLIDPHHDQIFSMTVTADQLVNNVATVALPASLQLTAGQQYYWGVQIPGIIFDTEEAAGFQSPPVTAPTDRFAGVTVFTHGLQEAYLQPTAPDSVFEIGGMFADASNGLVFRYDKATGAWLPTQQSAGKTPSDALGRGLVLLTDWASDSAIADSGFSEAAADAFFAGLVELDRSLQGALLRSPLHLIGHSRGTSVTSEIAQRVGLYFPGLPAVHVTTLDPHDFNQPNLDTSISTIVAGLELEGFTELADAISAEAAQRGDTTVFYANFFDPSVQAWAGVAFHDNVYQTDVRGAISKTPAGRPVPAADSNTHLDGRAGFVRDNGIGGPHSRVMSWYAGTVDLAATEFQSNDDPIPRTQRAADEDYPPDVVDQDPWYTAGESENPPLFPFGQAGAPWEGTREGFAYSVLGGGTAFRPHSTQPRLPVTTDDAKVGNLAHEPVASVFNGDFASSIRPVEHRFPYYLPNLSTGFKGTGFEVPGWSFHGGTGGVVQGQQLVLQNAALNDYSFKLEPTFTTLTHNRQYIPSNALQLKFAYEVQQAGAGDVLRASFIPMDGSPATVIGSVSLETVSATFVSAAFDLPAAVLGRAGMLEFQIVDGGGGPVTATLLLDNVLLPRPVNPPPITTPAPAPTSLNLDNAFQRGGLQAQGDVNGDSVPERIVVVGGSRRQRVQVLDGRTGQVMYSFLPFGRGVIGRVSIAAADFDGDGLSDIAVGTRSGGRSNVRIFRGFDLKSLARLVAFPSRAVEGVRLATADVTGDGRAELIVAGAPRGGVAHVKVFSGAGLRPLREVRLAAGLGDAVNVAGGDVSGDGLADVLILGRGGVLSAFRGFDLTHLFTRAVAGPSLLGEILVPR